MQNTEAPASEAEKIRRVCALIKQDVEADVIRFEHSEFTGRNVSRMYGNLAAAVSALAGMVDRLLDVIDAAVESHREDAPHVYPDGSTS